jgi:uncharacterized protein YndB with AHSA1/START domain/dihydrofolate reductase
MTAETSYELAITRVFDAPRELVYQAFVDPDQLAQWMGPIGFSTPRDTVAVDPRPGGYQRFTMVSDDDPAMRSPVDATLIEVIENELLVGEERVEGMPGFEGIATMTMRLEFHDEPGGKTRLELRQGPFTQGMESGARQGWMGAFTKLDGVLAALRRRESRPRPRALGGNGMRKLIESTFVSLGGDISAPHEWGAPYLFGPEPDEYNRDQLFGADALLLGRKTYEGLSAAYTAMAADGPGPMSDFVAAMNAIPKYVASTTLTTVGWNATLLGPDVAAEVAELKKQQGKYLLKYGTGPLDRILLGNGLVDELRVWIVPVTNGPGQRLFDGVDDLALTLTQTRTLASGVVVLTYGPAQPSPGQFTA